MAERRPSVSIVAADLTDPVHCDGLLHVLDCYARDPHGGGQPLSDRVQAELIPALQNTSNTVILLALADDQVVGIAICFRGLSTFMARPLLNIHDLAVLSNYQGCGVGRALLQAAEDEAFRQNCCKITLEVQDRNTVARSLYSSFGFVDFELDEPVATRFLSKSLMTDC